MLLTLTLTINPATLVRILKHSLQQETMVMVVSQDRQQENQQDGREAGAVFDGARRPLKTMTASRQSSEKGKIAKVLSHMA